MAKKKAVTKKVEAKVETAVKESAVFERLTNNDGIIIDVGSIVHKMGSWITWRSKVAKKPVKKITEMSIVLNDGVITGKIEVVFG